MSSPKRALITGITGQDGSYLAELLLEQGYEVHGMVRRASTEKFDRIEHLRDRITLHQGDLLDQRSLVDTLRAARPDEIYNLAAMSFVAVSWIQPTLTAEFTGVGVTRILEAMRETCPEALFYHESPRRGLEFVTRKITWHAAAIRHGVRDKVKLGNLDAKRDWGYAKDYVEAMFLMLQQDRADDYVIATNSTHTVRDCVEVAFDEAGLDGWERYIEIDASLVRPSEVDLLIGDPSKAERDLGWRPQTSF